MRLAYGRLQFEAGDTLHVEDAAGKVTLRAKDGHDCPQCGFYAICDAANEGNLMARFCTETHFVISEG